MLPEISRRCRSCGAAVRAGARFCPQCGALMEGPAAPLDAGDGTPETHAAESPREWAPPTREFSAFVESLEGGGQRAEAPETAVSPGPEPQAAPAAEQPAAEDVPVQAGDRSFPAATPSPAAGEDATAVEGDAQEADAGEARGRVARAREGARSRVEKIRDEAVVVLEETPDDSGLRFVVAAAALFLLFLLLFILSITVLR